MENTLEIRATGNTVRGIQQRKSGDGKEARALGIETGSAGGFLVSDDFRERLNVLQAPMQLPVQPTPFDKGQGQIPIVQSLPSVTLEGLDDPSADASITFAELDLSNATRREFFAYISEQLFSDAESLEGALLQVLAQAFAKSTNELVLVGTGSPGPEGVTNDTDVPTEAITETDVGTIWDSIHTAIENLGDAYRTGSGAAVAMGPAEYRTLRNLKDANNQPVDLIRFAPFGRAQVPYLDTFRVVVDSNTPSGELVFGDWMKGYEFSRQGEALALDFGRGGVFHEKFQRPVRAHDVVEGEVAQPDAFVRATGLTTS